MLANDFHIDEKVQLQAENTLNLPCVARYAATVSSAVQIQYVVEWARQRHCKVVPLGGGSNVILPPRLDALVLRYRGSAVNVLSDQDDSLIIAVEGGLNWHQWIETCLANGWHGLENLAYIPGTVGAAPIQNIGAYGVEVGEFIEAVHAINTVTGEALQFSKQDCQFAYRDSVFKSELRDKCLITRVDFKLSRRFAPVLNYADLAQRLGDEITPVNLVQTVVAIRQQKLPDPTQAPNAGSFFKNPIVSFTDWQRLATRHPGMPHYPQADGRIKLAAAWLIEQCGWKGKFEEGLGMHPDHALVMVNRGAADARQVGLLAAKISAAVYTRFGVYLSIEPRVYSE